MRSMALTIYADYKFLLARFCPRWWSNFPPLYIVGRFLQAPLVI